jgi:hypothetical protein
MKTKLLTLIITLSFSLSIKAQCFISATVVTNPYFSYSFSGGSFQSYGCAPVDPTYWISASGKSVTIVFTTPQTNPSIRVWGMNDDDSALVKINGATYSLSASTATYDPKTVCGLSPGPNGILFANGKIVGANTGSQGNYSYNNVQILTTGVSTLMVTGTAGAGWGFAGVTIDNCVTSISEHNDSSQPITIYPNPFSSSATIQLSDKLSNAEVNIYNSLGEKIKTLNTSKESSFTIERENLPAGVYFLRLIENNKPGNITKLVIAD